MSEPHARYYIEFIAVDHQVKVTALDPESGVEATVICPDTATQKDMSELAVRKLEYVLRKSHGE